MYASDSERTDHASDMLLITAIPTRPYTIIPSADDPDGHSEWIVHGPTKAKIVNGPGYLKPVPKPPLPRPSYVVKSSPGKGVGVFATRDIKAGELVLSERPLLVTPKSTMGLAMQLNDVMNEQNYDLETRKAILAMEWEKYLTVAVDRMLPEDKEEFMKLANCHQHDDDGPISGIVRTNSFMLDGLYDGREEREDGLNTYGGVTKIGSRFNHRCVLIYHPDMIKHSINPFTFYNLLLVAYQISNNGFRCRHSPSNLLQKLISRQARSCSARTVIRMLLSPNVVRSWHPTVLRATVEPAKRTTLSTGNIRKGQRNICSLSTGLGREIQTRASFGLSGN